MSNLLNMNPCLSFNQTFDRRACYAIFPTNAHISSTSYSAFVDRSNGFYFIWIKNSIPMFCSRICSSFFGSISHVVGVSSYKKMLRINTRRVVAFMKYAKTIWNWSFMKFIGKSMCVFLSFLPIYPSGCYPIGIFSYACPHPKPTSWSLFYVFKESIFNRYLSRFVVTNEAPNLFSKYWLVASLTFIREISRITATIYNFYASEWSYHDTIIQYQGAF